MELFEEQEAFAEFKDMSGITKSIDSVQHSIKDLELEKSSQGLPQYPVVTFLGTGSSVPSKYRCVSSILVETEPDNFIMLDCGEGTLLQIHRQFGREVCGRLITFHNYSGGSNTENWNTEHIEMLNVLKFGFPMVQKQDGSQSHWITEIFASLDDNIFFYVIQLLY